MDNPLQTWRDFFDSHAPHYLKNDFTQNTRVEVQFLVDLWNLPSQSKILDIGCGVGRHSIELAKQGFLVTGVDFSEGMLNQAKLGAAKSGVQVEWILADATEYQSDLRFDAALCVCEGGFGLIGHDEDPIPHDLSILRNIAQALNPNAPFVLTALNGYAFIRRMNDEAIEAGAFDPASMIAHYADELNLPEGKRLMHLKERQFIAPELSAMLFHAGFDVEHVWGGTAGDWGQRPLKLDEIEAMYSCRKKSPK